MSDGDKHKHLLIWNSAFRNNKRDNNCDCSVSYTNHAWLNNTVGFHVKSVTLTNLFTNVYGYSAKMYLDYLGVVYILVLPDSHIETHGELDALLQPLIQAAVGGTVTVVTDSDGYMTVTSTNAFTFLTPLQIYDEYGAPTSLNSLIGFDSAVTGTTTPYTFSWPVNLTGVRRVRFCSSKLASSHSIHPNKEIGDTITSLSLHDTDYGFTTTYEYDSSDNAFSLFNEPHDCATIDLELFDEYGQLLSLPDNAHVEMEFTVTSLLI